MVKKKCSVCDDVFSGSYEGVPYCNKHFLRMYNNGTLEPKVRKKNDYIVEGDVVRMFTSRGVEFLVDTEHLDEVSKHSWCLLQNRYLIANIKGKSIRLHRFILDINDPKKVVDHINGDGLDNRIVNLRLCDNKENTRNNKLAKNNTSGYTGVRLLNNGRYTARLTYQRKQITLGTYDTFEEAKQARIKGELEYFGEFSPSIGALKDLANSQL